MYVRDLTTIAETPKPSVTPTKRSHSIVEVDDIDSRGDEGPQRKHDLPDPPDPPGPLVTCTLTLLASDICGVPLPVALNVITYGPSSPDLGVQENVPVLASKAEPAGWPETESAKVSIGRSVSVALTLKVRVEPTGTVSALGTTRTGATFIFPEAKLWTCMTTVPVV